MKQMLEVFYSKIKNKERTPNSSTHLMGLKDRFGNVLEEPRFRYHIYNNQY